ncbi:MAG: DUF1329 domain-containing protein, partial [Pseudomonas profundi]
MNKKLCLTPLLLVGIASEGWAAPGADEIARLGNDLTPWGAIVAGNEDGTIAPYNGGLEPPSSYDPSRPGFRPDPFADEKPLFSVTAENLDDHAEHVSEGFKVMLRKYPGFRMDVYPSHRTAKYPDYVIANTLKNAETCRLTENGLQLAGTCYA